ncbi:LLM class flavin-dependent oxidoreductase [Rhizobium multihospitium]|uniref:FMN-dependent oxidoreductase, nitrilotriacetate monooxygenase family n=1 Tax=Rhizobium multihospitium TaxID=410764 RepID=A0A1C3WZ16_9HYPH|nr:LLM class flavin-dependent oxidoreductase [Rhizobium multihospitium]SCB45238.1 FMN-dependent oxidoreductase, nitrilotriacetate monooxygenase family [Rhizobium multihospitium]
MTGKQRQLKLGAFLYPTGHHIAAWRHPQTQADAGSNFAHYVELAQIAEAAKFDLIFLADGVGTRGSDTEALHRTAQRYVAQFEPITLLSALAAVTKNIGFVATASTSFNEPYHIARKFASLDHISGGRAGWNLVTSSSDHEAHNFGRDEHYAHAERYERAEEFADVVLGLWDTWEEDAFPRNKQSGVFYEPEKQHILNHRGKHFKVRGPLNVARTPQGQPVLVQAGSSEPGRELAARTAEVVFTAHQTIDDARTFYADIKGRLAKYGRDRDDLKIMPGIFPVVGRTREEAQQKFAELQDLVHPVVGLSMLNGMSSGVDLSQYPLDGPIPDLPETNGSKSRQKLLLDLARRENLTIRELYLRIAGARGHWQIVGTPIEIADQMEEWFTTGAADGFNVMPPQLPTGLYDFVEHVLPELRRRGLFRSDYEGKTLRENLGLKVPLHPARHAVAAE